MTLFICDVAFRSLMSKFRFLAFFSILILLSGLSRIALADEPNIAVADKPKRGGTLIWSIDSTPRHLNPAVQSGIVTGQPGTQLFASLLRYDDGWEPEPYLAESWVVSDDGLSVTLKLVKDAVFHDGVAIKSSDVAFSIKTVKENHPFKTMFAPVESVETPDPHTVIIRLSRSHPALLLAMSPALLPIIPEHIYGDGQDIKLHPANSENLVGSGPFKLVEFKRDQYIILERFDDFFIKDRPYLDKIIIRIIKNGSSRVIALENGEVHIAAFMQNPPDINRLKKAKNLVLTDESYGAIGPLGWVAFNTIRKPTSDVRVRRAIAYAIDRDFINKVIMQGTSKPALTAIHPDSLFYEKSVETYPVNIEKANSILDEAGYKKAENGMRFSLVLDYAWQAIRPHSEYVKQQLKKIAIDVKIRPAPDFPTWAKRISNHDFDMTWDIVFNWGDPVIGVHRTYQSSNIKKGVIWSNTQSYTNKEVDAIMEQAAVEVVLEKRKALYSRFQKILSQDLPVYWVYTLPYHTISSDKVGNPPRGIWGTMTPFDKVYLK